ncbi:MAG TPA: sugar ABC transporter ATP-binding protein [Rectinemataceae bacterium]|nr:sugar ABC transporter ATP-binding protein [Rectinemataceae bacterium]
MPGATDDVILRARGVTKVYPGTIALSGVDFDVHAGKVNILVGENGAGKSTLMKVIAGAERPTDGSLVMEGGEVRFRNPIEAQSHGIGIIYQEIDLCPNMSVADNIFLTREIAPRQVINYKKQKEVARALLERLEQKIDPDTLVGELGVSAQQIVAVAKALLQNVKVLIMDEPTSALTATEVAILFRVIRDLKSRGVAIVYISHRLEELMQIGDYITVLRDGKLQATSPMAGVDIAWIIDKMVGRTLSSFIPREEHTVKREVLTVRRLDYPRPEGGHYVEKASFSVHAGEIVGLYGLMGAGRSELLECLIGLHPESSAEIEVEGESIAIPGSTDERIARGLVLVPEDRQAAGIVQSLSVSHNITLASVRSYAHLGVIPAKAGIGDVMAMIRDLSIRVSSPEQLVTALSGGNQQKVVIAKALLTKPKVLLMDEPTRGIDVNAKSEIFGIMNDLAKDGMGILFASSELKEIMALSDRVLVMARGRITGEFKRGAYTEADLVAASAKGRTPA